MHSVSYRIILSILQSHPRTQILSCFVTMTPFLHHSTPFPFLHRPRPRPRPLASCCPSVTYLHPADRDHPLAWQRRRSECDKPRYRAGFDGLIHLSLSSTPSSPSSGATSRRIFFPPLPLCCLRIFDEFLLLSPRLPSSVSRISPFLLVIPVFLTPPQCLPRAYRCRYHDHSSLCSGTPHADRVRRAHPGSLWRRERYGRC